ncbi:winged helix-turn-helix domain-containing protein [Candidatus Thiothrix sp. Deng01]|uniref:Winged helix-turn-helix domain-containing protein n=1 Tax=Candidatus Thiothrix phosphatis TaxID=3112415 RepID=A0ABU6CTX5_9GAMM|nr:winged helix-turn-helix domain-containing protein [Candidatus Thiothrix sp. Deng01]MEB4590255.1 winged helix-turn-helix domain-containing protein [Candidatus Thiothrix sp. Deng01]
MTPHTLRLGSHHYDMAQQQLLDTQGQPCTLRHQSLQVLHELATQANKVVSKDELFRKVWPNVQVTDDSLVQCVADIRRALQDDKHEILKTVPRRGYVLVAHACADAPATNLPEDVLPFLGRHQEQQDLQAMLANPACRLISIVGMGGVGKSRLAKAIARQTTYPFAQGVCWVELAAVQEPDLIPAAIAAAAGIAIQGIREPVEQLQTGLASRQLLLVLDNMEHLLPEAGICQALLAANPHLKILVTSRLPTHVYGEWLYHLYGFPLPPEGELAGSCAAFDLFMQSARRVNHAFSLKPVEHEAVREICRLVEGLPLGIEIAASWVQHLTCPEILLEMRRHLQATTHAGDGALDPEPSALASVLWQSWQMLSPREQRILQVLALFRGKFSRDAASAISGAHLGDYAGLIGKSMLRRNEEGHYSLHEVMRQYASDHRLASQQHPAVAQRFVEYHLEMVEQVDNVIFSGEQLAGLARLEGDHDNFRECLSLCHPEHHRQAAMPELGLRMVGALGMFWFLANHWQEGYGWAERFLELHRHERPSVAQAMALLTAGGISALTDNHTVAEQYLCRGTDMAGYLGNQIQSARGLLALSVLRRLQGRYAESIGCGEQSVALFKTVGDEGGYQFNLVNMGHSLLWLERYDEAVNALEECIRLNHQIGMTISMPYALVNLGRLHWKLGDVMAARAYLQQSLQMAEQLGILLYHAQALCSLGWIEASEGNAEAALGFFRRSMGDYLHLGDREGQVNVMKGAGVAKTMLNELALAWQFMVVAEDLAGHLKIPLLPDNQPLFEASKQRVQRELSPGLLALHRNLGRASSLKALLTLI